MSQRPRLSILIPAVPSRFERAKVLIERITYLIRDKDIEILCFCDNKKRTIGEKREALKNISNGKYFMFVDDDDDILSLDEIYEAAANDVDVITFKQKCVNASKIEYIVTFGLGNPVETNSDGHGNYTDMRRPPFHVCAWNNRFKAIPFPAVNYAEDWGWVEPALKQASTEIHIDKVIHCYNFDPVMSEASTEDNVIWQNPNKNTKVIVNLVTNSERYIHGQNRLRESLLPSFIGDIETRLYKGEASVGAYTHEVNPYSFKIYAIEHLRKCGYEQILWLDASIVAVKPIQPVFTWLKEKGIFLETAGHYAGSWCNDYTLRYFDIDRAQAMKMPMFAAGYIGFDFTNPISIEFFAEWRESMLNGCFKGSWADHRHDMTCGSIIANKRGLVPLYSPGGNFFSYIGPAYGPAKETSVFHLMGL